MLTTPTTLARAPAAARCAVRGSRVVARATAAARPRAPTPRGSSCDDRRLVPVPTPPSSRRRPARRGSAARPRASAADAALEYGVPPSGYVPSPMDTSALQSELLVLAVIAVMTAYWWYVLVPGARVNLAVNKRTEKLRDYLEELKADDDRKLERFFYQKWLAKVDPETRYLLRDDDEDASDDGSSRRRRRSAANETESLAGGHGRRTRATWGRRAWRISSERRKKHQSFGAGIIPCWWAPPSPSARRPSSASSRTDQSGAGGESAEDPIPSSTSTTRDAIVVAL